MRTDPVDDAWDFVVAATGDQHALGPLRPIFFGLLLFLLVLSGLIALIRWLRDPTQRGAGPFCTWICRVAIGTMWFQACLWKLPLPVSGAMQYWTEQMAGNAAYPFIADLIRDVALPHLAILDPAVFVLELVLATSFILGLAVRPAAAIGTLYALGLWLGLYRLASEWPWQYIFLAVAQAQFTVHAAGRCLGIDGFGRRGYYP